MSWTGNTLPDMANYATVAGVFGLFGGVAAMYHRHNCHEPRCPALVRAGKTYCKRHSHVAR